MKSIKLLLLVAACAALSARSTAAVISFDSLVNSSGPTEFAGNEVDTEAGYNIEYFWYSGGSNAGGHNHVFFDGSAGSQVEGQHWNGGSDLQGVVISRTDLANFSLQSINLLGVSAPFINGYSSLNLLLSTNSTAAAGSSAFSAMAVATGGSYANYNITGFENVNQVWISSSSSINFNSITLGAPTTVPDSGSTVLLAAMGLMAAVGVRRKIRG